MLLSQFGRLISPNVVASLLLSLHQTGSSLYTTHTILLLYASNIPPAPISLEESQSCSASMQSSSWSDLGLFPPPLSPVFQLPRIPSYRVDHMPSPAHTLSYLLYASNVLSLILLKGFFSLVKMQLKYHLRSCLPTLAGSSSLLVCFISLSSIAFLIVITWQ